MLYVCTHILLVQISHADIRSRLTFEALYWSVAGLLYLLPYDASPGGLWVCTNIWLVQQCFTGRDIKSSS
jgi:hypothetical protein